jgi:DNA-binding transcriptional LysR family regulator
MDLWQINIFCKVVELKSFSKAGKAVLLSQPTVSSHIKDLEDHFACRLIDRLPSEAVPTRAGRVLYDYGRRLLALRDETETALSEFQGRMKGRLLIGGSTIPGGYILPRLIGAFSETFPDVRISLINGDTERIIETVVDGSVELGVVGARTGVKQILQDRLIEDEMKLVVPAGHRWAGREKIGIRNLLKEPFIAREEGSGTWQSIQRSLAEGGTSPDALNIIAVMGSTQAVIEGIKGGVGVSILSSVAVKESLQVGSLSALKIDGVNLRRNFYLTRHRNRSLSPLAKAFVNFMLDRCR